MGVILFAGGEDSEFSRSSSNCAVNTATTAARRTAYSRCALTLTGEFSQYQCWTGKFVAPATTFWATARLYHQTQSTLSTNGGNQYVGRGFALIDANGITRLAVCPYNITLGSTEPSSNVAAKSLPIALCKFDAAGTRTLLGQSAMYWPAASSMYKLDIQVVNYGTNATVRVYLENQLILTYTGDVTTDGVTALAGVRLHQLMGNSSDILHYSEVIAATIDTRSLTLASLAPAASGNSYAWTNAFTAFNEVTLDDGTMVYTTAANQLAQVTVTNTTVPAYAGVVSVSLTARAQKGNNGGPANCNLVLRTGSADYTGPSQALPTGSFDAVMYSWDANPANSGVWTPADLTAAAFNIGIKSLT